jgi:hypothetical protein
MNYFIRVIGSNINCDLVFGVARDFRIGGITPENYDHLIRVVHRLPEILKQFEPPSKEIADFIAITEPISAYKMKLFWMEKILSQFNLREVSQTEEKRIWERVVKIIYDKTRFCWHPDANDQTCTKSDNGQIKISSAHSIQRNRILKKISEGNNVNQFKISRFKDSTEFPIKFASAFYGFCDRHDKIFDPIEKQEYISSSEQNFLFAYRAFVHSSHIKLVFNEYHPFGSQAINDITANKAIFNEAIRTKAYNIIVTDTIVLDQEYPIAVSSASDLEFDYQGNEVIHSDERLEQFYLTVFPQNGKTCILFSYFIEDSLLYGDVINQVKKRGKPESDISVLIAGHCENVFFSPPYYQKFIRGQEEKIAKLVQQTQFDFIPIDGYGHKLKPITETPKKYLNNQFDIQLFNA